MTVVATSATPVATSEVATKKSAAPVPTDRGLRAPGLDTVFTLLFAVAGWCLGLRQLGDNSFLWHLRTGGLILDGGVPHRDVFSFTVPGGRWIAQSWLAELGYEFTDRLAGGIGVRLLVATAGALLLAGLYRLALRLATNRVLAAALTALALTSMLVVWSERPLLFGLAGMAALVWAVEVSTSRLGRNLFVAIPVIMWLWANVHGSFSLGYVYLALHVVGRWAEGAPPTRGRERQLVIATAVSVVVLLANPYGFGLLWFPVELMRRGDVLANVAEWQSPSFGEVSGMFYGGLLAFVALAIARQRPTRRDLIVVLPFCFLGLWAVRNVGLVAIVVLPFLARSFAGTRRESTYSPALCWGMVLALLFAGFAQARTASAGPDYDLDAYPVAAMQQLEQRDLLGRRMFTTDAWGGYTIWRYWPQQRVFMDDRYDMYTTEVMQDYDLLAAVEPGWSDTLDKWRIDVVVWPTERSLTQALAEREDWQLVHADDTATVFIRR